MSKEQFSFKRGWSQVPQSRVKECREALMEALGIGTRAAFLNRLNGDVEPKISQVKAIEDVFAKYGITDIWGNE